MQSECLTHPVDLAVAWAVSPLQVNPAPSQGPYFRACKRLTVCKLDCSSRAAILDEEQWVIPRSRRGRGRFGQPRKLITLYLPAGPRSPRQLVDDLRDVAAPVRL